MKGVDEITGGMRVDKEGKRSGTYTLTPRNQEDAAKENQKEHYFHLKVKLRMFHVSRRI